MALHGKVCRAHALGTCCCDRSSRCMCVRACVWMCACVRVHACVWMCARARVCLRA
jgi:hypothetical protein